jgi:hypothetical protein
MVPDRHMTASARVTRRRVVRAPTRRQFVPSAVLPDRLRGRAELPVTQLPLAALNHSAARLRRGCMR